MDAYCVPGALFFDRPAGGTGPGFDPGLPPAGWTLHDRDGWRMAWPDGADLPEQGWKLHVSATPDSAAETLRITAAYCVAHRLPFKHLPSRTALLHRNGKHAPRGGSGKFITVYPRDLTTTATGLDRLLRGRPGPYILSDARIGDGPVHARYGGFRPMSMPGGGHVPAIRRADGVLVPDERGPVFAPPDWVTVPPILARPRRRGGLPYRITGALHFSNGGGVYRAEHEGREIVLKEARPHAGLDGAGRDAVERLRHEATVLSALRGIPGVPEMLDLVPAWEHLFLVMSFVPGVRLGRWNTMHRGVHREEPGYRERAMRLADRIDALAGAVHERGWLLGDLHPGNVLVDADDNPGLIDFECALPMGSTAGAALGAPGFHAAGLRGADIDDYALAAIRLSLLMPLTPMLEVAPGKLHTLLRYAGGLPARSTEILRRTHAPRPAERGPVGEPASPGGAAPVGGIHPDRGAHEPEWPRDSVWPGGSASPGAPEWPGEDPVGALVRAIRASATPERADRLFPGDVAQFDSGGAGYGHGAAGVLHALTEAGEPLDPAWVSWLLDAPPPEHSGFWTGRHGVAWTLDLLGFHDRADALVADAASPGTPDLESGLAGVGLTLLDLAARRGGVLPAAPAAPAAPAVPAASAASAASVPPAAAPAARAGGVAAPAARVENMVMSAGSAMDPGAGLPARREPAASGVDPGTLIARAAEIGALLRSALADALPAGLLTGWSGPALFCLRLHRATGDPRWLDDADRMLTRDLERCPSGDGNRQYADGRRRLPYLGTGSAGVALVAAALAPHRPGAPAVLALPELRAAARPRITAFPGLMQGRAGLLLAAPDVPIDCLDLHAVRYAGGIAFPGTGLRRLSMDVATGTAGILLAVLQRRDGRATLPFLAAPRTPGDPAGPTSKGPSWTTSLSSRLSSPRTPRPTSRTARPAAR